MQLAGRLSPVTSASAFRPASADFTFLSASAVRVALYRNGSAGGYPAVHRAESPQRVYPTIWSLVGEARMGSSIVPNGMCLAWIFAEIATASASVADAGHTKLRIVRPGRMRLVQRRTTASILPHFHARVPPR